MAENTKPRVSAQGERLAFFSWRPGRFEIRYKDLGTGRETALDESSLGISHNFALAADGSYPWVPINSFFLSRKPRATSGCWSRPEKNESGLGMRPGPETLSNSSVMPIGWLKSSGV